MYDLHSSTFYPVDGGSARETATKNKHGLRHSAARLRLRLRRRRRQVADGFAYIAPLISSISLGLCIPMPLPPGFVPGAQADINSGTLTSSQMYRPGRKWTSRSALDTRRFCSIDRGANIGTRFTDYAWSKERKGKGRGRPRRGVGGGGLRGGILPAAIVLAM